MERLRVVCFTAGMMEEFEVIRTNATKEVIKEQLRINCRKEENGEQIDRPYGLLEDKDYIVELIGSQDDMKFPNDAEYYDWYDYYSE